MSREPLINVADYARAAGGKLPKDVCDYYEGGALDEITLRENVAGWERLTHFPGNAVGYLRADCGQDVPCGGRQPDYRNREFTGLAARTTSMRPSLTRHRRVRERPRLGRAQFAATIF